MPEVRTGSRSRRLGSPVVVIGLARDMELDAVEQGVMADRTRVCSAATKGLDVFLSGPSKVLVGDRREREQLDVVDLDRHGSAPVDAADLDLRPRPQAVRDRDGSVRHPIAKVRTELHRAILSPASRRATGDVWRRSPTVTGVFVELVTIVVHDYDAAVGFFVETLGFELVEDSPALTNDGRPRRWVVARPPGAETGLLLASADGEDQSAVVGNQGGRPRRVLLAGRGLRRNARTAGRRGRAVRHTTT